MAISLISAAKGSGVFSSSNLTVDVAVSAPLGGNVCLVATMSPTGVSVAPSLANVTWSQVTSVSSGDGSYALTIFTGVVAGTGGTTLAVLFDPVVYYGGDAVILQYAEFSGVSSIGPIDVFSSLAQANQNTSSPTCTSPSLTTTNAADCVIAYLTNLSPGEEVSLGVGPTTGFTAINNESSSGETGNLIGQLAYQVQTSVGTYSTSQSFAESSATSNYATSIILALAPPAAVAATAFVTPITLSPGIGSTGL